MDELDRQVTQMIQQHQFNALGKTNAHDPARMPAPPLSPTTGQPSDLDFSTSPATTNPDVESLSATRANKEQLDRPVGIAAKDSITDVGPIRNFDLEQVLAFAIQHSREYRSEKEELYLAAIDLLTEKHLWGPRFFSDTTAALSGTPERGDHHQAASLVSDLRATHKLPYGGEVSVRALVSFVEQLRAESGDSTVDTQSAEVEVELTLPLLRGAGKVAREDLIQAHRDLIYGARAFERFRREFLVSIATDYFDLLQESARIANLKSQLKNLNWLQRRITALADAGREPPFEVRRSEQQVLFAKNNLLTANERYDRLLDVFKITIGLATNQKLTLKPITIQVPIPLLNEVNATKTAWTNRLDYQTSNDRVADAKRLVNVARNDLLPDLNLNAGVAIPTTSKRDRAGGQFDAGEGTFDLGLTFSAPLDRRREQLNVRRSLITHERSKRNFKLLQDEISRQVRRAIRQIDLARDTLKIQEQNLEQAQLRRDEVTLRLRSLGPRDFIEAEEDLLDAQNQRDAAVRDIRVNVLQYLLDTGQMRVGPKGNWQPPTKLIEAKLGAIAPPASRLMGRKSTNAASKIKVSPAHKSNINNPLTNNTNAKSPT